VIPPVAITSYTLSPYTTMGAGSITIGTITLNQPAPLGGVTIAISASDPKPAKFPAAVTVAQGQTSATFNIQGNGVSSPITVTLKASYQGSFAPLGTSANTSLTVAPSDSLKVAKVAWSTSTHVLTVAATSTNSAATIVVQNANNNGILGTMANLGNGNYSFQANLTVSPSSINVISSLGGKTGQGVAVIP
jgi:hypothetical protein